MNKYLSPTDTLAVNKIFYESYVDQSDHVRVE